MNRRNFVPTVKTFSLRAARAFFVAAVFSLAFGIFSCENFNDISSQLVFMPEAAGAKNPGEAAQGEGQQAETGQGAQAVLGVGRVSGNIRQAEDSLVSKSVVPTAEQVLGGVVSYQAFAWGTKADGTVVPQTSPIAGTVVSSASGADFSLELEFGIWSIRANALDSAGKAVLSQTQDNVEVNSSSPVINLNFQVSYYQDASVPGSFALPIAFDPGAGITSVSYSLTSSNGTNITSASPYDLTGSGGNFVLDSSVNPAFASIIPANCDLVLEFFDASNALVIRLDQSVQIYSNITTNKIDGSAPYISGSGGTAAINITSDVVKSYRDSSVYVGGIGLVSGTAASDANSGTQFDPVEHLERALEILDASAAVLSPSDGFKIFLNGDTSLAADLAFNKAYKISVIGMDSSAYHKIDGSLSKSIAVSMSDLSFSYINFDKINGFEATGGQTALSNCKITNGKAPASKNGGGGLCVDVGGAKVVLANCVISGCASDDFGGAIYVGADSGSGNAEVELENCVIGNEESTACASDALYSNQARNGGGIYVAAGGKASLDDCKVFYNSATGATGGGINCYGGTIEISGGQINHNYAAYGGGGIYIQAAPSGAGGAAVIDNCVIGDSSVDEAATADSCGNYSKAEGGGGIYFASGSLTTTGGFDVKRNYCANNSTTIKNGWGGGIHAASDISLSGCGILYNFAENAGGGIYLADSRTATIDSCIVKGNVTKQDGGGLLLAKNSTATISGSEISYNTAEYYGFGGGVNVKGKATFTNTNISYNKALCVNNDKFGGTGGAIYIDTTGSDALTDKNTVIQNCQITNNQASNNATGMSGAQGGSGGGIAIISGECSISGDDMDISANQAEYNGGGLYARENSVTFNFSGGTISANTVQKGKGGAVYNNGILAMGGSAYIPAGSDKKNDVYLTMGKTISLASSLTATPTPVATITPIAYSSGRTVIDLAAGSSVTSAMMTAELAKFATRTVGWTIGKKAAADEGILANANIYVDGSAASGGEGTSYNPCNTVAAALTKVMAPNSNIILLSDTSETAALDITAEMAGLTVKSADTTKRTIAGDATKQIDIRSAATISNIVFDAWTGVNVDEDVDTVELNDVAIKNSFNAIAGGGLYLDNNAKVRASNLEVSDCYVTGGSGGGIYIGSGAKLDADGLVVAGCHVDGTSNDGGGIYNVGTLIAKDARISGCAATRNGAGICNDNAATLILEGDCDIPSGIYLTGGSGTGATAAKPIYVKAYFGLASGASKIPVAVEERIGADKQFQAGDAVVQGSGAYDIKEAQVNCFATSGTALSLEYDGAATPPCGKLVDKSIAGGVTVNLGGNISFEIGTPMASGEKARFNVIDNSSGTPAYVTPTSAQIKILQYGTPVYSADAQEVIATYLAEGQYELYCKAVVGGVAYDTTLPFAAGGKYTPLTLEAAQAGAVVTFRNKAADVVKYRVNGGTEGTIASGASEAITLNAVGDKVQFFGDNAAYGAEVTTDSSHIFCSKDCYIYGNIMSLVNSSNFASEDTLTGDHTFAYLFSNNTNIKNKAGFALLLPATTLKDYCYNSMFNICSITVAPDLPATTLADYCYIGMFVSCTNLTTAPELPATTLTEDCYCQMFFWCTSLVTASELPATTLATGCYNSMFSGCTSLATAPALPATSLEPACYAYMFSGCTSLTTAPALPALTLVASCYSGMFRNCTSLTTVPTLPATTMTDRCYYGMFEECSNLNSVTCLATDISASDCTSNWLSGVAATGTFTKAASMTGWTIDSASGIPAGWTVVGGGAAIPADFKKITAGDFKRAATASDTAYTVTISKDFYMCEHEVTQEEFTAVMGSNPSSFSGSNLPVENVSWYQAIAYCNKRSVADGLTPCYTVSGVSDWEALAFASIPTSDDSDWNAASYNPSADGYRLPTEAEWEYAALGAYKGNANWNGYGSSADASAIVFAGYNGSNSVDSYAWYGDSSGNTHAVKGKTSNSNGLYDMSGNVWEWCWDWNGDYASANVTDPTGASTGSSRVNRGGGWFDVVDCCSVACRGGYSPYDRHYSLGFRVVRNAP